MHKNLIPGSLQRLFAALVLVALAQTAAAAYPDKTVRIIVPYSGGAADTMARVIASKFSEIFKQNFIVESKTGANGIIGVDTVVKAPADGLTLLYEASTSTFTPYLYKQVPYDLMKDVQPIGQLISYPYVIVVNPSVPARNFAELVKYLRDNGNRTNVASGSASLRVLGELFKQIVGVDYTFIPYKGGGPATISVMAGETQMAFQDLPTVAPLVAGGRLRAIAVTGDKRSRILPDVPTAKETGLAADFVVTSWHGLFAPANTPADIVNRLNSELNKVIAMPDVAARISSMGADPAPGTANEFATSFRSQLMRWKEVTTRAQIPLSD